MRLSAHGLSRKQSQPRAMGQVPGMKRRRDGDQAAQQETVS